LAGAGLGARMDSSRNVVVSFGLNRLFHEIVKAALSNYGWRVLDPERRPFLAAEAEIVLVSGSGPIQAVVNRLRSARTRYPSGKVVLLGAAGSDTDLVRFIEAGVSSYVSTNAGLGNLIEALQMVRNNRTPSSGRVTQLVMRTIRRLSGDPHSTAEAHLTLREQEIFRLVQDGLSNKEIASRLRITPNTVKNHVHHLLEKLRVRSRHEAAWLRSRRPRPVSPEACTGTGE
jgi:DNA-binding NarL/FixJ family response regulator